MHCEWMRTRLGRSGTQLAFNECDELFRGSERAETDDAKFAGLSRQTRFSDSFDCLRRNVGVN